MLTKRVFVSDVHMSAGRSFESAHGCYDWFSKNECLKFEEFLAYLIGDTSIQEVIFLGDMMDTWVYPIEIQPPTYNEIANAEHIKKIMTSMQALANSKKGNVTYVIGNHDMTLIEEKFNNFRQEAFSGITFKKPNEIYETDDGIHAEHGHQYTMYCAIDPKHELPLGHYISRLAASLAERGKHHYTSAEIEKKFSDPERLQGAKGLKADPLVNMPLSLLADQLDNVDDNTPITTVDSNKITLGEIRQQYANLGHEWIKRHGLMGGLQSIWREAVGLGGVARKIATKKNKKVVIFGHTHNKDNCLLDSTSYDGLPGYKNFPFAIYANCGAWCQDTKPTYVVDEYDISSKKHTITLKFWGNTAADVINTI